MYIYKCDRCGKIFEKYPEAPRLEIYEIRDTLASDREDLCPECTEDLTKWFNKYNV